MTLCSLFLAWTSNRVQDGGQVLWERKKKDYAIPPVFQCCLRRISNVKNNGKLLKQTACLYRPADSQ